MEPVIAKGTKEKILDAALASFSSVGYDGTSLDDLAVDHRRRGLADTVGTRLFRATRVVWTWVAA